MLTRNKSGVLSHMALFLLPQTSKTPSANSKRLDSTLVEAPIVKLQGLYPAERRGRVPGPADSNVASEGSGLGTGGVRWLLGDVFLFIGGQAWMAFDRYGKDGKLCCFSFVRCCVGFDFLIFSFCRSC